MNSRSGGQPLLVQHSLERRCCESKIWVASRAPGNQAGSLLDSLCYHCTAFKGVTPGSGWQAEHLVVELVAVADKKVERLESQPSR